MQNKPLCLLSKCHIATCRKNAAPDIHTHMHAHTQAATSTHTHSHACPHPCDHCIHQCLLEQETEMYKANRKSNMSTNVIQKSYRRGVQLAVFRRLLESMDVVGYKMYRRWISICPGFESKCRPCPAERL